MKLPSYQHLAERPLRSHSGSTAFMAASSLMMAGAAFVPQASAQVQVAPTPAGSGRLYLSDFFKSAGPDQLSHGEMVKRSAQQLGFQGEVVTREVGENGLTSKAHKLDAYLDQRQFSPEEMRKLLSDYTEQCQVGQMQTASDDLKLWLEQGAHRSAINLSRGCGQSQVVDALYQRVSPGWEGFDSPAQVAGRRRLTKVAAGLEVDLPALLSPDREISGPARLQLQQRLVDLVEKASLESKSLQAAQDTYDGLVRELAQRKVSVVVAAANSGNILEQMARDANGLLVKVPANFWNNRLASAETVAVGGTEKAGGAERVGHYTNYDQGIDFFADGEARVDPEHPDRLLNYGTSFAAPRIAATLSAAHQAYPDWSNSQVEDFVAQQLSGRLADYQKRVEAPALDAAKAHEFLISGQRR